MVLPVCKFCEANAGHKWRLRLPEVKWGTIRQDCSPLLFLLKGIGFCQIEYNPNHYSDILTDIEFDSVFGVNLRLQKM